MAFNGWLIKLDPRIHSLGYVEAKDSKGLFYKRCSPGVAFLDHRIDTDYDFREQYRDGPRYYFRLLEPKWKGIRLKRFEEQFLREHDIAFMPSHIDNYETRSEVTGRPEDGFCHFCKNDFQDKGIFCSEECERNYKNQGDVLCEACQEPLSFRDEIRHHISYYPEQVVSVHQSCHMEIHRSDKHLHLRPTEDDTNRFYKKGKFDNENVPLPKYTGRLDDFSHFH